MQRSTRAQCVQHRGHIAHTRAKHQRKNALATAMWHEPACVQADRALPRTHQVQAHWDPTPCRHRLASGLRCGAPRKHCNNVRRATRNTCIANPLAKTRRKRMHLQSNACSYMLRSMLLQGRRSSTVKADCWDQWRPLYTASLVRPTFSA